MFEQDLLLRCNRTT